MEKSIAKKISFNGNQLKILAIITMTIDHTVSVLYPGFPTEWWILLLHMIGRITAPTMWFFIAEGYHYTHNLKKYMTRMFLFAVISHFAYNFAFGIPFIPFQTTVFNQTSVIWPLAWALVALKITYSQNPKLKQWMKYLLIALISLITFCADWSSIAVLAILDISMNRGNLKKQMTGMLSKVFWYALVYFLFINKIYGAMQMCVVLAIPFLYFYNGERGKANPTFMKWLFYIYYPLHLVILGIIRILIWGNVGVLIGS